MGKVSRGAECRVFKFVSLGSWTDCGHVGTSETIIYDLYDYNGTLIAGCGTTGYAYSWDGATTWASMGRLGTEARVFEFLYDSNSNLYACSAASGKVWLYAGGTTWTDYGQLGSQNYIHTLCEYEGNIYAGSELTGANYNPYVYRMISQSHWSQQGELDAGSNTSNTVNRIILFDGHLYAAGGGSTGDGHVYTTSIPVEDISSYVQERGIGRITKSTERKICKFQPSNNSVKLNEPATPVFFKSDKTGLFDPDELEHGYQLRVFNGFEGVNQWIKTFGGKVIDRPKRPTRDLVNFSIMGWLDALKDRSAEIVADEDEEALANITGVTISEIGQKTKVGAKTLNMALRMQANISDSVMAISAM